MANPKPMGSATGAQAGSMLCPDCKVQLSAFRFQTIDLDLCHQCHGIWFDAGELNAVANSDTLQNIDRAFEGEFAPKHVKESVDKDPARRCPRDGQIMNRYEWNPGSKLVIDNCGHCNGTWLDAGELEGYTAFVQKNLESSLTNISPELKSKIKGIADDAEKRYEAMIDETTRQTVKWDVFCLDDMIRGIMRFVMRRSS